MSPGAHLPGRALVVLGDAVLCQVDTKAVATREAEARRLVVYGNGCRHGIAQLCLVRGLRAAEGKINTAKSVLPFLCQAFPCSIKVYASSAMTLSISTASRRKVNLRGYPQPQRRMTEASRWPL